jgi:5-methylcytosine-specific restriction endonuclease McrA
MPGKPQLYRPPHMKPPAQAAREYDAERGSASERGYDWRWQCASGAFLAANPLCLGCLAAFDRTEAATLTDHTIPAADRPDLFWLRDNWQGACDWHHNAVKPKLEAAWRRREIADADMRLDGALAVKLARELRPEDFG